MWVTGSFIFSKVNFILVDDSFATCRDVGSPSNSSTDNELKDSINLGYLTKI